MVRSNRSGHAPASPRASRALASVSAVLVFVVVFLLLSALAGWFAGRQFPAPEQSAIWAMIGRFVAGLLALGVAMQTWWWLRHR
ncbi:MAG: hypothetical protein J0H15_10930 [Xanthomonadales bacterium]|nr:hypothetical protein [Xanthomonadales bacterium]